MKEFCNYTGLSIKSSRTQTLSYGKSVSQKVVQRNNKINEVCDMYKVDFGKMSKLQIFELDRKALQVKRNDFVGSDKRNGNFTIMLYNN